MKYILEVNNKTAERFQKAYFKKIFQETLLQSKLPCISEKTFELSIALVGSEEILELNSRYRKKNKATDVLSFAEYETVDGVCDNDGNEVFIGELIVCPEYVRKNALIDNEPFEYALSYIVAHGILHLLGLSHGKKMFAIQKEVADVLYKK